MTPDSPWENRYQSGDMPWEKGEPAPGLIDFLAAHPAREPSTVLVPGCGTGHDARAWAQAGYAVQGLDIAPSAIRLACQKTKAQGVQATFLQADFLSDPPHSTFDWVFEHTLFCAIQPAQRPDYVQAVRRWLKPEGQFLAIYYMIPDEDGPPFGTTRREVQDRFEPYFAQVQEWVPRSYPNRTNLEWMVWWRKRPKPA